MAATPTFAHVVLQTNRLEEMRDWYCTVLDAHVVFEGHGLCFITFDEEHHRIAFLDAPVELEPKSPTAAGMHHTAYTFDSLDDLLEHHEQLERRRHHAQGSDPARGHDLAVLPGSRRQLRRASDRQLLDAGRRHRLHARPQYSANPVGVSFDPALMRQARRPRTPMAELITRSWALSVSPELRDPMPALTGA